MRKSFYASLAMQNMKKNYRTVIPYLLACTGMIMMQYIVISLAFSEMLDTSRSTEVVMQAILLVGIVVVSLFSIVFIFYTNSFLMKRRTKEIGLFNILGMEKKHISRVMFYETLYIAVISIISGIFLGVLFSKLVQLGLFKIVQFGPSMGLEISWIAIKFCVVFYGVIFLFTLFNTIRKISSTNPIELLKGGNVGEKEPKTNGLFAVLGIICLGSGYWLSQTTKSPIEALLLFFVAVFFVIIGTYLMFVSGSIFILKLLKKNKKFYYKTNNFTAISGMIYRMKQNAVGLANICILSTCVLVLLSTTISLYLGIEDSLGTRFPRNISVSFKLNQFDDKEKADQFIENILIEQEIDASNLINYRASYRNALLIDNQLTNMEYGMTYDTYLETIGLYIISVDDYNRISSSAYELDEDECLLYRAKGASNFNYDSIYLGDKEIKIVEELDNYVIPTDVDAYMMQIYYVIVEDPVYSMWLFSNQTTDGLELDYEYLFDTNASPELQIEIVDLINTELVKDDAIIGYCDGAEASRESFMVLYGTLLFVGVFLGILFTMATSLIIYYKQISEGYEDIQRYNIMQKVGMSKHEVQSSIKRQILMVFFLPLGVAIIHIVFSFNIISKLLIAINFTNVELFIMCMIGSTIVFSLFYLVVYLITSGLYYRIVKMK